VRNPAWPRLRNGKRSFSVEDNWSSFYASTTIAHDMNSYMKIGLLGLAIQATVNLVALLVFKNSSAEFFSQSWWASWFPTYIVWFVFSFIGLGNRAKKNGGGEK
jgi:ABC-type dipeptide/oligopeptide/nickel transport system permease subunit